jgi:beta-1,4-mannosyl-glycoprotein beta-1,4-N-acetylglucosaminyltransferase
MAGGWQGMIYDLFLFNDELDMLECRLTEFDQRDRNNSEPVLHIPIEAPFTHRDEPKPLYCRGNWARFERWHEWLLPIVAKELPTTAENPDPWSREHAQREYAAKALKALNAKSDDIILHGDVDEIPRMSKLTEACQMVRANPQPVLSRFSWRPGVVLEMRLHSYAVDWCADKYLWRGTVITTVKNLPPTFTQFRDMRNLVEPVRDAGWHLTWLGGDEAIQRKLKSHCHTEMTAEEEYWPASGQSYRMGRTHGGIEQVPVDDLSDYPVYIRERRCPESWFRPRESKDNT